MACGRRRAPGDRPSTPRLPLRSVTPPPEARARTRRLIFCRGAAGRSRSQEPRAAAPRDWGARLAARRHVLRHVGIEPDEAAIGAEHDRHPVPLDGGLALKHPVPVWSKRAAATRWRRRPRRRLSAARPAARAPPRRVRRPAAAGDAHATRRRARCKRRGTAATRPARAARCDAVLAAMRQQEEQRLGLCFHDRHGWCIQVCLRLGCSHVASGPAGSRRSSGPSCS